MTKKIFITFIVIATTLLFSSFVFATNAVQNATKDMGNEMRDSWDKLGNTTQNMGNNVKGAMDNVGNTLTDNKDNNNTNNTDNVNSATAGTNNNTNDDNGWFNEDNNNTNYTATRTTGDTTTTGTGLFGMNTGTMWTWIILALVGVAIVSLVWYFSSQSTTNRNNHTK